jgi:cytoplasmic iron level regulating protein YaaA (DUF328/UPF0246 family)
MDNTASAVFFVSCVAGKKDTASPAGELYTSTLFRLARAYIQKTGAPWFILSAEHGLLSPNDVIEPYDKTLNSMGVAERRAWAEHVIRQMTDTLPDADEAIIFAGSRYREHLVPWLKHRYERVTVPMEGLRIGEQLSWLSRVS